MVAVIVRGCIPRVASSLLPFPGVVQKFLYIFVNDARINQFLEIIKYRTAIIFSKRGRVGVFV